MICENFYEWDDSWCELKKGGAATIVLTYNTTVEFESLTYNLTFSSITPSSVSSGDFCQFTTCPIEANKVSTATLSIAVPISLSVRYVTNSFRQNKVLGISPTSAVMNK